MKSSYLKIRILLLVSIFLTIFRPPVLAQEKREETVIPFAAVNIAPLDHSVLSELLQRYVNKQGLVDYRKFKRDKDDQAKLNSYCEDLLKIDIFAMEPAQERLSAFLNLYNALALREVLKNYPVQTTAQIPHFFDEPRYELKGFEGKQSLIDLENLFHQRFTDPRHNLARVNVSLGGPVFLKEAFNSKNLEKQLEEVTQRFVNDSSRTYFDARRKVLVVSPLFLWFEQDFKRYSISVRDFFALRFPIPPDVKIEFGGYDWKLNDEANR